MPYLDIGRTRIKITFFPEERNGVRYLYSEIAKHNMMIGVSNPTPKSSAYTVNLSLEAAYFLKRIFKDEGWRFECSPKYRAKIQGMYEGEKKFKIVAKISEKIKTMHPDAYNIEDYEFRTKPWANQKIGFLLLKYLSNMLITADMRTGKTYMVASHLDYMVQQGKMNRILVLSPLGIMESTWIRDVYNRTHSLKGLALNANGNKARVALAKKKLFSMPQEDGTFTRELGTHNYLVLNHDAIKSDIMLDYVLKEYQPDCLVVDESHHFKTPTTLRTKAAMKVAHFVKQIGGSVICMTGTPVTKDIRDIYSQMRMVDYNVFNFSFTEFKNRYCIIESFGNPTDSNYREMMKGMRNFDDLKQRYEPRSYRVEIEQCHDMPEQLFTTEYVEMSKEQRQHHDMVLNELITMINSKVIEATTLTKFSKLVQITGGYLYDSEKEVNAIKDNAKMKQLIDILDQVLSVSGRKVVIWTNYRPSTNMIRETLMDMRINFAELTTQSSMSRNEAEFKFLNDPECRVMLATPSLSEGKDMSVASYVIYYDNSYKFVDRAQSERRTYTPESLKHKKVVYIDLIARDSIDELIYEAIRRKQNINDAVTKERLKALMKIGRKIEG